MPWSRWLYHLFERPWRRRAHTPWESEFRGLEWGPERAQAEVSRKCYPSAGPPESPLSPLSLFSRVLSASCALLSFSVTSPCPGIAPQMVFPTCQGTQSPSQALFSESWLRAGFPPIVFPERYTEGQHEKWPCKTSHTFWQNCFWRYCTSNLSVFLMGKSHIIRVFQNSVPEMKNTY